MPPGLARSVPQNLDATQTQDSGPHDTRQQIVDVVNHMIRESARTKRPVKSEVSALLAEAIMNDNCVHRLMQLIPCIAAKDSLAALF
jgi:hypothetical protein